MISDKVIRKNNLKNLSKNEKNFNILNGLKDEKTEPQKY